ncbi:MAG TPA: hydroxymethylpyrimidine/phosphomethylpyrimidine kinase [Gammaproteobacteria bacterium]|jgi:hydroxymethylpyrimidine/phosphomethylpyrimidine kinase|nr:hydroxymethylpyrimidine/phosphomethylpyrimidine kinase [Gammaproteobacteria bacterium]
MNKIPVVMTFGGHDPSGGAGLQADIEALASQGCHAAPVLTALTVQDTRNVTDFSPVPASHVIAQARAVLEDMPVAAFKIGMLASTGITEAVHSILADYPDIPLVLDPVLASGAGTQLAEDNLPHAICEHLLPLTTVLTPNSLEARQLAPAADTLDACAIALLEQGAAFVLLTGTHEQTTHVVNTLYQGQSRLESFTWERLPHSYHGSGCTLASTIAAMLAHGLDPFHACHEAQDYTWNALSHGYRPGQGQHLPDRLFWSRQAD